MSEPCAVNPADFAGLVIMVNWQAVEIVNLKQKVASLCQQLVGQAHLDLPAIDLISPEVFSQGPRRQSNLLQLPALCQKYHILKNGTV